MPEFRALLPGDGEMADRIRAFDWAATPLGTPDGWPQSLRSALSICLNSSFATSIYWGPELRLLYNDAWMPIPGPRHPHALGQPASEVWADIWHVVGPQLEGVFRTCKGFSTTNQRLPMRRFGSEEEVYWDYSFTPIAGEDGGVAGVLNQGQEVTERVFAQRRAALALQLTDRAVLLGDPRAIALRAAELVAAELGGGRAGYGVLSDDGRIITVDDCWTDGAMSDVSGTYELGHFGQAVTRMMATGDSIVINDTETDPRLAEDGVRARYAAIGIRACAMAPVVKQGRYGAVLFVHAAEPQCWAAPHEQLLAEVVERLWQEVTRAQAEAALRISEERHRLIFEQAQDMILTADLNQRLTAVNPAGAAALNAQVDELLGRSIEEFVAPGEFERTSAMLSAKLRQGGTTRYEVEVNPLGQARPLRWEVNSTLAIGGDGRPIGLHAIARDVTARHAHAESQLLLINELNHRVKNTLAIVQGLAIQSFRDGNDPGASQDAFQARLAALAGAHDLLVREQWEGATLDRLRASATRAYEDRLDADGPPVRLPPKAAVSLALAFHELATNAAKYGALSVAEGQVSVAWWWTDSGRLTIEWRERGGPPVEAPRRRGFGLRMIERALAVDLRGTARIDFAADGVSCTIDAAVPDAPASGVEAAA